MSCEFCNVAGGLPVPACPYCNLPEEDAQALADYAEFRKVRHLVRITPDEWCSLSPDARKDLASLIKSTTSPSPTETEEKR